MMWQTVADGGAGEIALRAVRNSTTGTSTVTIAIGTPLVLETATASTGGGYVRQAVTSTDITNNLFVGVAYAALNPDSVGLAQVYGVNANAFVATAGASVGVQLIPNIGTFITVGTNTNGNVGVQGGGSGALTVLVSPSGAANVATAVFIRAV
jgi:hypothetical protein